MAIKRLEQEPPPTFYGIVRFHHQLIKLHRASWRPTEKSARTVWYAKIEGQDEYEFQDTRSDTPSSAIGMAILGRAENREIAERLWA